MEELRLPDKGVKIDFTHCDVKIEKMFDIHDNGTVIVNCDSDKKRKQEKREEAETPRLPAVLDTPQARELWAIAQEKGWVDDKLNLCISIPRAAILASVLANELDLQPRWTPFENLWSIDDLACKYSKAQYCSYYPALFKEMTKALS